MDLINLPNELVIKVLSYTTAEDILRISDTNEYFKEMQKLHGDYIAKLNGHSCFKVWYYKTISKNDYDKMMAMCIVNMEKNTNVTKEISKDYLETNGEYNQELIFQKMNEIIVEKLKMGEYIDFDEMNHYYFVDTNNKCISIKREDYAELFIYALEGGNEKMVRQLMIYIHFIDYIQDLIVYGKKYPNILKYALKNNKYRNSDVMVRYSIGYNIMQYLHVNDLYDTYWKYLGEKYEMPEHNKMNEIFNVIKAGDLYKLDYIVMEERLQTSTLNNMNYIRVAAKNYNKHPEILEYMLSEQSFMKLFSYSGIINVLEEYKLIDLLECIKNKNKGDIFKFYRVLSRN